jgi:cyclohexanone monooxygenase
MGETAMPKQRRPQAYYDEIKNRFKTERDLRLHYRPPGTEQYTSAFTGDLEHYAIDPYAGEVEHRDPIEDSVEVLFIGGGFSALGIATRE